MDVRSRMAWVDVRWRLRGCAVAVSPQASLPGLLSGDGVAGEGAVGVESRLEAAHATEIELPPPATSVA